MNEINESAAGLFLRKVWTVMAIAYAAVVIPTGIVAMVLDVPGEQENISYLPLSGPSFNWLVLMGIMLIVLKPRYLDLWGRK